MTKPSWDQSWTRKDEAEWRKWLADSERMRLQQQNTVDEQLRASDEQQRLRRQAKASREEPDGDGFPYNEGEDYDVSSPVTLSSDSFNIFKFLLFQNSTLGGNLAALIVWGLVLCIIVIFVLEPNGITFLPSKQDVMHWFGG